VAGVVVLIVIAVIAGVAWRYRRKDLAALATIGLICSVCVVVDFASVPRVNVDSLSWLVTMLWLVAYLWWLTVVWAVIEVVRAQSLQRVSLRGRPSPSSVFGVLIGVLVVIGLAGIWRLPSQSSVNPVSPEESTQVSNVVRTVASKIPPGAVTLKFWPTPAYLSPEGYVEYQYGQAILWQLTTAGFEPLMQPFFTTLSGITYPRDRTSPTVNVIMTDDKWSSQIQEVVIGSYNPPLTTTVVLPSDGATVSGPQGLGAITSAGVTQVQFEVTGGDLNNSVIATATPTKYGWLARWMTTNVPDGTYTLRSVASNPDRDHGTSPGITITVAN
jgi:hypothetical protein